MQLTIDKEFQSLLLPLTPDEYQQLKQNIIEDGCREPLVIWNNIIVDGHNRYQICTHNDIPFTTVSKDFADREAVKDWIDSNQLGRRNLTSAQSSMIRLRMYNREKKKVGEHKGNQHTKLELSPNVTIPNKPIEKDTASRIAEKTGVHRKTIFEDVKLGKAIDDLEEIGETIKQDIQNGEKIIKKNVIAAAKAKINEFRVRFGNSGGSQSRIIPARAINELINKKIGELGSCRLNVSFE